MEARIKRTVVSLIVVNLCCLFAQQTLFAQRSYQATSQNFVVFAPDARLAQQASTLAEQYRKQLSIDWLGYEIETWRERCPIHIQIGPHAGGETSFAFVQNGGVTQGEPISWQMKIYGPVDRLLDAVLPHEVTHTIFATHFGQPLPRWADEGACTTVEHASERAKNHRMLISFLTGKPSRGIPFNRMFTMKQYPHDILPLYAQGYSVARYLIGQKGRQHFVKFLEKGMSLEQSRNDTRSWNVATSEYYGYEDLSDLQISWLKWVRDGSPDQTPASPANPAVAIASSIPASQPASATEPVRTASLNDNGSPSSSVASASFVDPSGRYSLGENDGSSSRKSTPSPAPPVVASVQNDKELTTKPDHLNTWYARQSRAKQAVELPQAGHSSQPTVATKSDPFGNFRPGSIKRADAFRNPVDAILKAGNRSANSSPGTIWR